MVAGSQSDDAGDSSSPAARRFECHVVRDEIVEAGRAT